MDVFIKALVLFIGNSISLLGVGVGYKLGWHNDGFSGHSYFMMGFGGFIIILSSMLQYAFIS